MIFPYARGHNNTGTCGGGERAKTKRDLFLKRLKQKRLGRREEAPGSGIVNRDRISKQRLPQFLSQPYRVAAVQMHATGANYRAQVLKTRPQPVGSRWR